MKSLINSFVNSYFHYSFIHLFICNTKDRLPTIIIMYSIDVEVNIERLAVLVMKYDVKLPIH